MFFIYQGRTVADFSQLPALGMRAIFLGESIFTSTRYQVGRPMDFWPEHLQRLATGAELLLGVKGEAWEKAQADLLGQLDLWQQQVAQLAGGSDQNYYLRITGLAASCQRALSPLAPLPLEWLLAGEALPLRPAGEKLVLLLTSDQRGAMPIKWGNYGPAILAGRQMSAPAQELLFVREGGEINECATSNFFAVLPGPEIWTPPVGPGVFAGIYRHYLIRALGAKGYVVREQSFGREQLASAVAAFTTNCVQGMRPVGAIIDPGSGWQQNLPSEWSIL